MAHDDTERPEPTRSGPPSCAEDGTRDGEGPGGPAAGDWPELPAPLRARLAEIAGTALGGLPPGEVPTPLRRFARFTPAKRARLGGQVLVARLQQDAAFRAAVVAWWAENRPGELELPETSTPRPTDDPSPDGTGAPAGDAGAAEGAGPLPAPVDKLDAAAVALLTADPLADRRVAEVGQTADLANLRAERDEALAKVDKLTAELERARAELVEERERARMLVGERETEYLQMRRRVSDQGARLRAALDARSELEAEVARLRVGVDEELARARAETAAERERADRERRRAEAAAGQVAAARQAAREARRGDEVRLELLLDTVSGAISGLRRELDIGAGGPRPADLVAGTGDRAAGARAAAPVDGLAALDALLSVPSVHLIVDGYNVSKTGYPDLPLADQRSRLVAQLSALGARTGAEITVVFDGAAVIAAPVRGSRGVRVLFSDAGVIADDVVRDLVAAEPAGRPLLVATSDQELVRSVRRRGAHTVASAVLLRRLGG
ncbi:NYN domain-containing protein [Pseudonocardia sp. ICBG601]|uniref:NYN domain-containing protein n=1 Tax=Pseudonocardia sp. ICBG601 TaxID=2846759 RepID=UPI001CF62416|nr:NYN domain-containing protein [Pseudonocardia sp. ICBG601]